MFKSFESTLSGSKNGGVNSRSSAKSPIQEPEWCKIINPIFSDIHSNLEIASKERDVLSHENSDTDSEEEQTETSHSSYQEEDGEDDLASIL